MNLAAGADLNRRDFMAGAAALMVGISAAPTVVDVSLAPVFDDYLGASIITKFCYSWGELVVTESSDGSVEIDGLTGARLRMSAPAAEIIDRIRIKQMLAA